MFLTDAELEELRRAHPDTFQLLDEHARFKATLEHLATLQRFSFVECDSWLLPVLTALDDTPPEGVPDEVEPDA